MSKKILITGAGGFVGRHLLRRIAPREFESVCCVSRSAPSGELSERGDLRFVRANFLDLDAYASELEKAEAVVHLAAVTGRAPRKEHFRVNAEGTAQLINECKQRGVRRFLYVSSIAAGYANVRHYHYAQSKQRAEQIVRDSGLDFAIVRPTIVLAQDAPLWGSLLGAAGRSPIKMPGNGRARIQPIWVDDLVDMIRLVLRDDLFDGGVSDLGGLETLSFENFLRRIHRRLTGNDPRVLHLPLGLMSAILGLLEPLSFGMLPVTAGQLAVFGNDGTVQANELMRRFSGNRKSIDDMLELLIDE